MANSTRPAAAASTAEGFVASVFKYSISSFASVAIFGATLVLTGLFVDSALNNQAQLFFSWTATIMNIAMLGMDQGFIRFYHEPPGGIARKTLFQCCFFFSALVLGAGALVCSVFFGGAIHHGIGLTMVGQWMVPLLFLNAFFYMVARYFNVLYRMEGNIRLYTVESILMQFFLKMFYLLGAFLPGGNPAAAMILCGVLGLGGFALVFAFLRRDTLRLSPGGQGAARGALRQVLPYGAAIAPTAIMVTLNSSISQSMLTHQLGKGPAGVYGFAVQLSNVVTIVQGGFASFWGPYMFQHYKTQQARIKRVHNYLNVLILVFFAALVAFEDIIFLIMRKYPEAQPIFPMMMLSAVFVILCETTVYGNAIARRPIFDTLGHGLSLAVNLGLLMVLPGRWGLQGAAVALAAANGAMFLLRTYTAQRLYSSIATPRKTALALAVAVALAAAGGALAAHFWARLAVAGAAAGFFCLLYRREAAHLCRMGLGMAKKLLHR